MITLIDTSKPRNRETKNSKKPLFALNLDSVLSKNRKRTVKPTDLKEPNTLASLNIPASPENTDQESSSDSDSVPTPPPKHTIQTARGSMDITWHGIKKSEKKIKRKTCPACGEEQKSQHQLNIHMWQRHPHLKFGCNHCEDLFATYNSAYRHVQKHYQLPHKCDYCPKHFMYPHQAESHETLHTGKNKIPCEY